MRAPALIDASGLRRSCRISLNGQFIQLYPFQNGRAAILRAANERIGEERWLKAAEHLETLAMAQIVTDGSYGFGDVLGLFQGAAGTGLELLDGLPQVVSAFVPQVLSAGLID